MSAHLAYEGDMRERMLPSRTTIHDGVYMILTSGECGRVNNELIYASRLEIADWLSKIQRLTLVKSNSLDRPDAELMADDTHMAECGFPSHIACRRRPTR